MSFDLTQWGERMELMEKTIQTLEKKGFTTIRVLNDEEWYADLDMIPFSLGQNNLFWYWQAYSDSGDYTNSGNRRGFEYHAPVTQRCTS